MLKKGIYIFTAFCLLNTMFCFQASDLMGAGNGNPGLAERGVYGGAGTLLDLLLQQFQDDGGGDDSRTPLKVKGRHNFFLGRSLAMSIQAPVQAVYRVIYFFKPVQRTYGNYLIRKATLPTYYNFLFRLKPF